MAGADTLFAARGDGDGGWHRSGCGLPASGRAGSPASEARSRI